MAKLAQPITETVSFPDNETMSTSETANASSASGSWNETTVAVTERDPFSVDSGLDVEHTVTGAIFVAFAILPNILVLAVVFTGRRFRRAEDWLVIALCSINFVTINIVSWIAMIKYTSGVYPGRWSVCHLQSSCIIFSGTGNLLIVAFLSLDRSLAINMPFRYKVRLSTNGRAVFGLLLSVGAISVLFATLPFMAPNTVKIGLTYSFCSPLWSSRDNKIFSSVTVLFSMVVMIVIIGADFVTVRGVWRMKSTNTKRSLRRRWSNRCMPRARATSEGAASPESGTLTRLWRRELGLKSIQANVRRRLHEEDINLAVVILLVTTLYVACLFPSLVSCSASDTLKFYEFHTKNQAEVFLLGHIHS